MSDEQVQSNQRDPSIECSMCGRVGGPTPSCDLCLGNQRFSRARQFTISEERRGENPGASAKRYGPLGEAGPEQIRGTNIVFPRH